MKKFILILFIIGAGCGCAGAGKTVAEGGCDRDVIYGASATIAGVGLSFDLHAKCIELDDD